LPRAKYIKPPGSLPTIEQVRRSTFRFRSDQWRKLSGFLPRKLATLSVPSDYVDEAAKEPRVPGWTLKKIAELAIQLTEEEVSCHLAARPVFAEGRNNPVNVCAAIRRLRKALEPFTREWVDPETADIVPADLDNRLAAREQELARLRLPRAPRRALALLCQRIRVHVTKIASANGATISKENVLKYIDFALACAGIKHPDFAKHRDRLAALVFPPKKPASPLGGA
jgi:hypothetical protein